MAVYTKNFYIKGIGTIGGKEVTASIDKVLDNALSPVGKKASDYHSQEPKPKKVAPKKAPSKKSE